MSNFPSSWVLIQRGIMPIDSNRAMALRSPSTAPRSQIKLLRLDGRLSPRVPGNLIQVNAPGWMAHRTEAIKKGDTNFLCCAEAAEFRAIVTRSENEPSQVALRGRGLIGGDYENRQTAGSESSLKCNGK